MTTGSTVCSECGFDYGFVFYGICADCNLDTDRDAPDPGYTYAQFLADVLGSNTDEAVLNALDGISLRYAHLGGTID